MYKKNNKITLNIIIEWFLIYNIIIRVSWHICYNVWNKIIARRKDMTKEDKERYEIIKEDLIVLNRRLHQVKLKRKEQRHIKKIVDKQMEDLDKEIRDLNSKYKIFDNMEGIR